MFKIHVPDPHAYSEGLIHIKLEQVAKNILDTFLGIIHESRRY